MSTRFLSLPFTFFFFFVVAIPLANSQNISLGLELVPTQTTGWASPNGNFQLSFYTSGPGNVYFLGILFNPINKSTVTWSAATTPGVPLQVGKGASLKLSQDGDLVLFGELGSPLWRTSTSNQGVAGASMGDNGNFYLYNSSGNVIWQSFDSPTDTLLPGQQLQTGKKLTNSIYTAGLEANGNFSLVWLNDTIYWSSDTSVQHPVYVFLQQATFGLYDNQGNDVKSWRSNDFTDNNVTLRRVSIDEDGNLRIYSWSSGSSNWMIGWQALEDQCQVYGYCGANGLCSYDINNPICTCAGQAGFVPIDSSSLRKGCKGGNVQNCSTFNSMVVLNHTQIFVPNGIFYNGEADCQQACLKDSQCIAATATNDGSGSCLMRYGSSFSGYQEPNIASNSFLKVCGTAYILGPPPSSPSSHSTQSLTVAIVESVLGTLVVVILLQLAMWLCCCGKCNPGLKGHSGSYALLEYASGAPLQFTYRELQSATRNFTEKLGEGAFGAVYKGMLPNKTEIAVKQLERVDRGERQFRTEVAIIGSTHHMNLVRLCGFCVEAKHRLLVYEFMKNSSFDRYLFNGSDNYLEWPTRFNVLVGTARGIAYLHEDCRDCIVHCDIKPENILLDKNFCAKVSDFGLAKLINDAKDRARNLTTIQGTRGYLAPEWRSNLPITAKSDVFSFGVVVLETISGRKNSDTCTSINPSDKLQSFSEWAFHECFVHNRMHSIVDKRVRGKVDMEELDRAVRVSFWCMQVQPSLRPSMRKVIQMLEGMLPIDMPPMPKSFEEVPRIEEWNLQSQDIKTASRKLLGSPKGELSDSFNRTMSLVINPVHAFNISGEAVPFSI